MLSDRFYKYVDLIVTPSVKYFAVIKYSWNSELKLFELRSGQNKTSKLLRFNQILLASLIIFNFIQFIRFCYARDFNSILFLIAALILLTIAAISCFLFSVWADHVFSMINAFFIFLRQINCKFYKFL